MDCQRKAREQFGFRAERIVPQLIEKCLSFADRLANHAHYLVLQRTDDAPGDVSPQLADVYLERDDQCWGGYGGIESVFLERGALTIHLGAAMARRVGGYEELRVEFEVGDEVFVEMKKILTVIMGGYEGRLTIAG